VQFQVDGVNVGNPVTGAGPVYSYAWNTAGVANGSHVLTAVATDAAGNAATSAAVTVTVNNAGTAPVISGVSASGITASGATISWTTDKAADSQVAYGLTASYGSMSGLNPALSTTHTVTLSGLAASTTYHYQVLSRDGQGNLASSGDYTFTTAAAQPSGSASVTWTLQPMTAGWPGYNGWLNLWWDPVSRQTILYGVNKNSTSIYSTDLFAYNSATNTWTHISGTGSTVDACPQDTPTQPGNRHPGWQMAIDTKRNVLWLFGGVCQGNILQDMYYLQLNADPTQDTWRRVYPAHFPAANNSSAMVYDPDDDVLFLFGSDIGAQLHDNWVYCRTLENPTPGSLTARQAAAGCTAPDDWSEVHPAAGIQPAGVAFPGMVYDTVTKKVILYGGMTGGGIAQNETWAYDVPTRTWTKKALQSTPPPVYKGTIVAQPAMAYNSATNKIYYHQTSNTGAPADWLYDPVADAWTKLTSSGPGAVIDQYLTYDAGNNLLVGFSRNVANGSAEVRLGSL